jgi:hypothetical protein
MQLPTHFVAAVLIDKSISQTHLPRLPRLVITAAACYLSHGVLDKLARATYHPPDPLPDHFWGFYHHYVLPAITGIITTMYAPQHALAMFFSGMPDLDWVLRGLSAGGKRFQWDGPVMNEGLHHLLDKVPVINQLNRLPNLRLKRYGVLVELGLVAWMFTLIKLIEKRRK